MSVESGKQARQQRVSKRYSLVPCDTFEVVFDRYTPRPHFIILSQDKTKRDYDSLDSEAKLKVVKTTKTMVSHEHGYHLEKSAILSLHFGSWRSKKTKEFHAHICVDVDDYLRIFYEKKDAIPKHFPSGYAGEVRQYAPTYYEEDLEAIDDYLRAGGASASSQTQSSFTAGAITGAILYHPSEPRVGFVVTNSEEPRSDELHLQYLEAMIQFAKENNLTVKDGEDACHVCLFLDEKAHGDPHG